MSKTTKNSRATRGARIAEAIPTEAFLTYCNEEHITDDQNPGQVKWSRALDAVRASVPGAKYQALDDAHGSALSHAERDAFFVGFYAGIGAGALVTNGRAR